MADTTVEILNATFQWGSYSATGPGATQSLFTTDASTRYVIKDVELDANGYTAASITPALTINSIKVANLSGNLTGSEIVDVNSAVSIMADTSGAYFTINGIGPGDASLGLTNGLDGITGASLSPVALTTNTYVTPTTGFTNASNARACWVVNGDFYYYVFDTNSTTQFFKRAGGINGAETAIMNISYAPVAFDGVSKFYWVAANGYLYVYNCLTGTTNSLVHMSNAGSTYPCLTYCNGFLMWMYSYSSGYLAWYHAPSGNSGLLSGAANFSSSTGWNMFYDPAALTYRIAHMQANGSYGGTVYYTDVQANSDNTKLISASGTGSVAIPGGLSLTGGMSSLGGKYALMFGSNNAASNYNTLYLVDKTMSVVGSKTVNLGSYNFTTWKFTTGPTASAPTTAQKNAIGPSIKIRITGVKQV